MGVQRHCMGGPASSMDRAGKERPVMIRTALSLVIVVPCTASALAQAPAPESEDMRYTFNRADDG